ncbi:MAG: HAD family hydrolase [Candidatus Bathyarchaeota archaeon]|nr:HAD family hydrolase [Candidatus Bathyarchaeota archaeon]
MTYAAKTTQNKTGENKPIRMQPQPVIDAVLFDLFDTLVLIDDEHESYIQSLKKTHQHLTHNGLNATFDVFKNAFFKAVDSIENQTAISLEEPHFSLYIEQALTVLGAKLKDEQYVVLDATDEFSKEFKRHLTLDPQALDVLEPLHKRYKTGLISNLSFSECAWELLDEYQLKDFLDVIVVSGDINLRKPHPQIFSMALRYLRVKPNRALFVGDTLETDVFGSKKAGMTSVHIKRRPKTNPNIKPHLTITRLQQLLTIANYCRIEKTGEAAFEQGEVDIACQL